MEIITERPKAPNGLTYAELMHWRYHNIPGEREKCIERAQKRYKEKVVANGGAIGKKIIGDWTCPDCGKHIKLSSKYRHIKSACPGSQVKE